MAMPKSQWKAKHKTARTNKRSSKRKAAQQSAQRGRKEVPRGKRVRKEQAAGMLAAIMAQSLFSTLTGTARKSGKFNAGALRQRGKAA